MANDYAQYNPGTGFVGFSYGTEDAKLKRQQELARLLQTNALKGKDYSRTIQNNVGTFYAGGSGLADGLASMAQALMSRNGMDEADASKANLDQKSMEALAYHLNGGQPPAHAPQAAQQPSTVQPSQAQSFPVRDGYNAVDVTDLDEPRDRVPFGAPVTANVPQMGPAMPAEPMGHAPAPTAIDPSAAADVQPKLDQALSTPKMGDQIKQLVAIANTGPVGQQIASAQFSQLFGSKNGRFTTEIKADPVNGGFVQVVTDTQTGATRYAPLKMDGGGEKVLETKDTPNGIMERTSKGWRLARDGEGVPVQGENAAKFAKDQRETNKQLDAANQAWADVSGALDRLTDLDPKTGKPRIDAAAGFGGKLSNIWNAATGVATDASAVTAEADSLKSQLYQAGMASLRSAGGGAGAANSDAEGKRLESMLGALDIQKMGTAAFIREANRIKQHVNDRIAYYDSLRPDSASPGTLAPRKPGSAPQPLNYGAFK